MRTIVLAPPNPAPAMTLRRASPLRALSRGPRIVPMLRSAAQLANSPRRPICDAMGLSVSWRCPRISCRPLVSLPAGAASPLFVPLHRVEARLCRALILSPLGGEGAFCSCFRAWVPRLRPLLVCLPLRSPRFGPRPLASPWAALICGAALPRYYFMPPAPSLRSPLRALPLCSAWCRPAFVGGPPSFAVARYPRPPARRIVAPRAAYRPSPLAFAFFRGRARGLPPLCSVCGAWVSPRPAARRAIVQGFALRAQTSPAALRARGKPRPRRAAPPLSNGAALPPLWALCGGLRPYRPIPGGSLIRPRGLMGPLAALPGSASLPPRACAPQGLRVAQLRLRAAKGCNVSGKPSSAAYPQPIHITRP